ncbi:CRISPR-associated protein Csy1 [Marinomonas gallaica]|uniref:CRISPR-associated protein Csy1 n=1 Tax=Marinomonas gallaica TaxID=1806667 RepID=A0A1C3JSF7_9GAMM|nr:type I-F CRISPR-associated protein Csy1 [Marinomonas gallaica]SBT18144.1 CRISPR-associated protein Csy1 [Marinomonas gallaica]SBT22524.1 CRISPR-associated protein Csy1 [Marinomonas gallaica]
MEQEGNKALSDKILDYINSRKEDRLEKFDKETEKGIKAAKAEEVAAYEQQRFELRVAEEARFKENVWLDDAAGRAKQLQLVTHALKFTHSDAKGTSIFADQYTGERSFIGSHSIESPAIDIVGNAAALDVGKLLMLEDHSSKLLVHYIQQEDMSPFQLFAATQEQLTQWLEGFKLAVTAKDPSSNKLAKQLYWPLQEGGYHILMPLFATSLTHDIYDRIQTARFSEEQKAARDARRNEKVSDIHTVEFPDIAVQAFGGTKPQNISQLNSTRGGRAYLLSSAPPTWESQEQPPLKVTSIFRGPFSRKVYPQILGLKKFLVTKLNDRSTWKVRNERAQRIDDIVDRLIGYAANVRNFPAGWSSHPECHLPEHQKLWLDPKRCRIDADFKDEFDKKEWQSKVAEDFSRFLNAELERNSEIATGDVEFVQWKVLTAQELRLVKDDVEGAFSG